ncbi:hypothetical protein GRI40_09065 [Altererythrobacter aerius]|uniref:PDZ domain-containing protein n=1 Tax=Tsuneonella aeria TaxID=1837929 RepID=A0A6I4TDI4_9SPHN|nr:PDZ domain-containing protein [Tsuneonella aeria]MXO75361.1 hypothetical protein [Tsuneonella aeria]
MRQCRGLRLIAARVLAGALFLCAVPARAGVAEDRAALHALQAEDLRLQSIGWRLATGNAPFCNPAPPAIGLLLQDMANYSQPAAMRAAAGIAGDMAVGAVVPGSPAAAAGMAANDEILSIADRPISALPAARPGDWRRLANLHDAVDAALARDGAVTVAWRDAGGTVHDARVTGVPACYTRFELLSSGGRASADGKRVVIGRDFSGLGMEEPEMAAALAHELAHNLLAHRAWLRKEGRTVGNIRQTEREADRLMPWLLANAGYDPAAAARFFRQWGPRHGGWIFRARTHDGWDERAEFVTAELPKIAAMRAAGGMADWRTGFARTATKR